MTKPSKPKRPLWVRLILCGLGAFGALVLLVLSYVYWWTFHPFGRTPVVGPAGSKYRAFVYNRGIRDFELVVCASDWPYTFRAPFLLGHSFSPQEYSSTELFWSRDGTVLAFRVLRRGETAEIYEAAYDFREHRSIDDESEKIAALIEKRGGLGPRFDAYPDPRGG